MRAAGLLLVGCLLVAAGLHAQPAPTRVYGVEVDSNDQRDRVLVFADGPVQPKLHAGSGGAAILSFPGASLDPSAPRHVVPKGGGPVRAVVVSQSRTPLEVRVTIAHAVGVTPSLSQRGQQVALDFPRVRVSTTRAGGRVLPARWLNIRINEAVDRLARFVGMRLIHDDTLRGMVDIEAQQPLTEPEAAAMIDALLLLKGYAAVPGPGGFRKVLPLSQAPGPWVEELSARPDEVPLTTLVRLEDVDADLVLESIKPLVGNNGIAELYEPSNAILLAGPGSRMRRLADVIQVLDHTGYRKLVLIPLHYADAQTAADALDQAIEDRGAPLEVWPDERTNRLMVRGRPVLLERARAFLARFDRPKHLRGNMDVVPVRYADPDKLAEILRSLASQQVTSGVRGAESLAGRQFAVSVDPPTHSLVVEADPETMGIVNEVVGELDRPPRMVDVEVTAVEVTHNASTELALDSIIPILEPQKLDDWVAAVVTNPGKTALTNSVDANLFASVSRAPLLLPFLNPLTGQPVQIQVPRTGINLTANASSASAITLLQPRLRLVSGEEHEIFSGDNIPVPVQATGASSPLLTRQTVERHDTGVTLRVKPSVPEEGPIVLNLTIEVSSLSGSVAAGPTFSKRTIEATARLESGMLAVIGWAETPERMRVESGVPWLMHVPILGAAFRHTEDVDMRRHLVVAVRADRVHQEAPEVTEWMRRRLSSPEAAVASGAGAPAAP